MARTAAGAVLTDRHRLDQVAIRARALRHLVTLWQVVDPVNLAGTIAGFATAAAVVVRASRDASTSAAAEYYREFRAAEHVGGEVTVVEADELLPDAATELLRAAGLAGIIHARRSGSTPAAAAVAGLVKVNGTASSLVLGGARDTLTRTVEQDPRARRWQRVTSSDPCSFCRMVASRGAVYYSRSSAGFQPHDHCACQPEPVYAGSSLPAESARFAREWRQAQRDARDRGETERGTGNDGLNAYRRFLARQDGA